MILEYLSVTAIAHIGKIRRIVDKAHHAGDISGTPR